MLKLLDVERKVILPITQYKDLKIEKSIDFDDKTLSFSIPVEYITDELKEENYIRNESDEYVIKSTEYKDGYLNVSASVNIDELEGKFFETFYAERQTLKSAIDLALAGTGWTCTCSVEKKRTLKLTAKYVWDIIKQAIKTYRVEMVIDSIHKNVTFVEQRGENKGVYFSEQLNLKSVSRKTDTADFYTRIIPVGKDGLTINEVNNNKEYLENYQYSTKVKVYYWKDDKYTDAQSLMEDAQAKLNDMSKPYSSYSCDVVDLAHAYEGDEYSILAYGLGDTVSLMDSKGRIYTEQRIVKITEYPDAPMNNTCELANTVLTFEEYTQKYDDTSDTVDNVTTDNGTLDGNAVDSLDANKLKNVNEVIATTATISNIMAENVNIGKQLNAVRGEFGKLDVTYLTVTKAKSDYATVGSLEAEKARIDSLETTSAVIKDLDVEMGKIHTLMFGSASGESLTTQFSNSIVGLIGDAQIKSAMIQNLDVNKINAGNISTTKFNLQSDSGRLAIADNTIFIKDANRTRVQIGKDASNDYSMYVWDKDGNLMFDALGLTQSGITRKIIRNDVVADNANINASKLDISSLFTQINGSTQTIKSSKILVDSTEQTLDVAFTNMSTSVSTAVSSANTAQNVANNAKTTADSIKDTADNALSKANTVATNLTTLTDTVMTQGTQITTVQGSISNKIWQQDITTAVTGLNYENRNLLRNNKTFKNNGTTTGVSDVALRYTQNLWANTGSFTFLVDDEGHTVASKSCTTATGITWSALYSPMIKRTDDMLSIAFSIDTMVDDISKWDHHGVFIFEGYDESGARVLWQDVALPHGLVTGNITQSGVWTRLIYIRQLTGTANTAFATGKSWSDVVYIGMRLSLAKNGSIHFRKPKLEIGTKATPYSEAPEDTDASILALQGATTTLSNNYTSLNQTLTSLNATVNSHTDAISKKADDTTVTTISDNVAKIKLNLNEYKTTVSSTYSTKAEFNNLQVGGRNLIIDTNKENIHHFGWGLQQGGCTYTHSVAFGTHCWTLKRDGVVNTGWNYMGIDGLIKSLIEPSTYYTLSFDVLSTARSNNIGFGIMSGSAANKMTDSAAAGINTIEPNVWTKIVLTVKTLDTLPAPSNQIVYMSNFNRDVNAAHTFRNVKLEKGTKNTDWSPAPEDVDNQFKNYSTTTQMNSAIEQKSNSILLNVSGSYVTKTDLQASLNVKVDSDKLISSITGSADVIQFTSKKFGWASDYSSMQGNGKLTCSDITLNGGIIKSSNYVSGYSGMQLNLATGTWDSRYTQISSTGAITCNSLTSNNVDITGGSIYLKTDKGKSAITLEKFVGGGDKYQTSLEGHQVKCLDLTNGDYAIIQPYGIWFNNSNNISESAYFGRRQITLSALGSTVDSNEFHAINPQSVIKTYVTQSEIKGYTVTNLLGYKFTNEGDGEVKEGFSVHNGNLNVDRGTTFLASAPVITSDIRKKHAINLLDIDKIANFIYTLKPSEFQYTDGTSGRLHHGLIAQDVKMAMGIDDWGLYAEQIKENVSIAGLRQEELIADLIATLQSLNNRIKELETKTA